MKYSKIAIRNTIRRIIEYFKMQEDVSSQEEMTDLWNKIAVGINKKKQKRQRRYFMITTASAAALIGFIWLGTEKFLINNSSDFSVVATKMTNESAVGDDIQLIVSQEEVIPVKKGSTVTYSQSGTVSVKKKYPILLRRIYMIRLSFLKVNSPAWFLPTVPVCTLMQEQRWSIPNVLLRTGVKYL